MEATSYASAREESESTAKPPEWWTPENTAAWTEEVWGKDWTVGAMATWGHKIDYALPKAGAIVYRPLSAKELVEYRKRNPLPANRFYYDGTPIAEYKPLTVKRGKK